MRRGNLFELYQSHKLILGAKPSGLALRQAHMKIIVGLIGMFNISLMIDL